MKDMDINYIMIRFREFNYKIIIEIIICIVIEEFDIMLCYNKFILYEYYIYLLLFLYWLIYIMEVIIIIKCQINKLIFKVFIRGTVYWRLIIQKWEKIGFMIQIL